MCFLSSILMFRCRTKCTDAINVGLISDGSVIPGVADYLTDWLLKIEKENNITGTSIRVISAATNGCFIGVESGEGASLAIKFYYENQVRALFGPMCYTDMRITSQLSGGWNIIQFNFWREYFSDTLDSSVQVSTASSINTGMNICALLQAMKWDEIGLVWSEEAFSDVHNTEVKIKNMRAVFDTHNIKILVELPLPLNETNVDAMTEKIASLKNRARVIVPVFGSYLKDYLDFLRAFRQTKLNSAEYIVVIAPNIHLGKFVPPWTSSNDIIDENLKSLFDGTLMIINEFYEEDKIKWFKDSLPSGATDEQIMIYLSLYEAAWVYLMHTRRGLDKSTKDIENLDYLHIVAEMKNSLLKGPFGDIILNQNTVRLSPFSVFYTYSRSNDTTNVVNISVYDSCINGNKNDQCTSLKGNIIDYNLPITRRVPLDKPVCGFNGEYCDQTGTILIVAGIITVLLLLLGGFLIYRRLRSGETAQMPWAVPYEMIKFVDLGSSSLMSIHSLKQQIESQAKTRDLFRCRKLATIEQGYVIVEGFALKERLVFDRLDMALLHQMKQAVHDNINPFIGICFDKKGEFYAIWKHCFRGTLADLMLDDVRFSTDGTRKLESREGPAFDQNFKSAFVRDIIRGLEWLHSSPIGFQGCLTPSQCLIDSHWILKISGFGLCRLLYKWKAKGTIARKDSETLIPNSALNEVDALRRIELRDFHGKTFELQLHYYSPEMRRLLKLWKNGSKLSLKDGRAADMYSFGIVLYEIVYRRKMIYIEDSIDDSIAPEDEANLFCESAEALIPLYPLIPDNSDVHPDLVGLMHKCWNGNADQRPDATLARKITDATLKITGSLVDQMIKNMEQYTNNLENLVKERTYQLEEAQKHADRLLSELLPKSVADELKVGRRVDAKTYKSATILYSDIVGFTSLCSESQPMEVVTLLSGIFKKFDMIISQQKCYKVETIGDAYMVASGVPISSRHNHVRDIATVAIMQRDFLYEFEIPHRPGEKLHCRWGFNTGPVFAGVVGLSAPRYCVFGNTVTVASKMENSGLPDRIQMTLKSYQLLTARYPEYKCSPRGSVRLEGIGTLLTYWLDGCEELLKSSRSVAAADDDNTEVAE